MTKDFGQLAKDESINIAKEALQKNGIEVLVAENGAEAKEKVFAIIPQGAEIMNMTSVTLETLGIAKEIAESGKYNSIRKKFETMDRKTQGLEMQKLGAAPEWAIGSVHAVTEDGKIIVASATGSQLPAYAYGSSHVIWVVGAQKIVKDLDEGMKRVQEYVFPLENERAKKAYGAGSSINKILIFNKEGTAGRITMIIVKEKLGF
ncbi:MAG: LUD domain-containing protein [Candidatus Staskawiczbacteria bacterium]|nr:LUD domain-containing protein [Candidatus Staskawiczbacteria bacterium]